MVRPSPTTRSAASPQWGQVQAAGGTGCGIVVSGMALRALLLARRASCASGPFFLEGWPFFTSRSFGGMDSDFLPWMKRSSAASLAL